MLDTTSLKTTPLTALNIELGGKMVGFAGYEMPVQFAPGVMKEHLHTRARAGLFDVSHMGQVLLRPKSGKVEDAALALERLVPVDILGVKPGRQRYALFTDARGGILDDLMVANRGDHLYVVVNASCKEQDVAHMRTHLSDLCEVVELTDRALVALQGPEAEAALSALAPEVAAMAFMDVRGVRILGVDCIVSRSGYSGEDGYEVSVPADTAVALVRKLLENPDVQPIGLGARDSLRLEAGLCLYGNDIDTTTTPVAAALEWAVQKVRRSGGTRAGGFPGADVILAEFDQGAPRRRVGIAPEGRAPIRGGTALFADETSTTPVGQITSGGFGPTTETPVAMGYVATALAQSGTRLFAELRGKRLPVTVADLPFITPRYKR
ncbi:glycine cleavage system aminomethyltransferase GcvT [Tabrizicola soli]|uniref:aminomethyltransferase n=1 Tax=Tabrizicola soli TaxID=2185115 RepID=A0ABV7DYB3_9RHOB|nr:glycine cleavage system aminomethyltransferase GcvT [Tabrizicola soli]